MSFNTTHQQATIINGFFGKLLFDEVHDGIRLWEQLRRKVLENRGIVGCVAVGIILNGRYKPGLESVNDGTHNCTSDGSKVDGRMV